jgi:cell division transport system permease protein
MRGWQEFRGTSVVFATTGRAALGALAAAAALAATAVIGAAIADRAVSDWVEAVDRQATVIVRARVDETGAAAAARAAEVLAGVAGVEETQALDRATAEALVRPWTGEVELEDVPLPMLVTVELDAAAPASRISLGRALAEAGLDAEVDDDSVWRDQARRAAAGVRAAAAALSLIALAAALALAWALAAAAVAAGARDLTVLHQLGADPGLASRTALKAVLPSIVGAAGVGATVAALVAIAWRLLASGQGPAPGWGDPALALTVPAAIAAVATLSALRALRESLGADPGRG